MIDFRLRRLGFVFFLLMNIYLASPYNPTSHISEVSASEIMAKANRA